MTLVAMLAAGLLTGTAVGAAKVKTVRYRDYSVRVPASWPVFRLTPGTHTCVRFNRHAVYLGTPSITQICPSHSAGRTEAILVSPTIRARGGFQPEAGYAPARRATAQEHETQISNAARGVTVTATWDHAAQLIRSALHVNSLSHHNAVAATPRRANARFQAQVRPVAHASSFAYTGTGFDTCSTPSTKTMSAWSASPYRALGIYIGGANSACAQPNLNTTWMETEWAAGWHMVPIYVGLQAPSNSCGCQAISASQAASQGTAAATDAVAQAQAVGIGAGNPIYNDMEGYSRTSANSTAVMNFLAAWTNQLHAEGYSSGVYSSGGSGVADLAARYGTTYPEPDDIWVADWNGSASTSDSYIPTADWTNHQRLHQYRGAHNESYGGATINIDSDYLDGDTAFGAAAAPAASPSLQVTPTSTGPVNLNASWPGESGVSTWKTLGGANPTSLTPLGATPVAGGTTGIVQHSIFRYYEVQALNSSGAVLGTSAPVNTQPHVALYGRSAFVPRTGVTGVPAGCFTGAVCQLTVTVTSGRSTVAKSGAERLNTSGGDVFFTLNATGRRLLTRARGRRLPVRVTIHDVSGRSASSAMNLVPYTTLGSGPRRSNSSPSSVKVIGLRDFVLRGATGGILAGCQGSAPCLTTVTLSAGGKTVASSGRQFLGANSAGYLSFRLSGYGRALLARATGNQLATLVTLRDTGATARAHISLSSFR